jgi:hypothetical protein
LTIITKEIGFGHVESESIRYQQPGMQHAIFRHWHGWVLALLNG